MKRPCPSDFEEAVPVDVDDLSEFGEADSSDRGLVDVEELSDFEETDMGVILLRSNTRVFILEKTHVSPLQFFLERADLSMGVEFFRLLDFRSTRRFLQATRGLQEVADAIDPIWVDRIFLNFSLSGWSMGWPWSIFLGGMNSW